MTGVCVCVLKGGWGMESVHWLRMCSGGTPTPLAPQLSLTPAGPSRSWQGLESWVSQVLTGLEARPPSALCSKAFSLESLPGPTSLPASLGAHGPQGLVAVLDSTPSGWHGGGRHP